MKKNKGITLIALVITIIVLLILAGVTINAIVGSESAMEKAKEAKEETDKGNELDLIKLAAADALLKGEDGQIKLTDLNASLTGLVKEAATGDSPWTVIGNTGTKYLITNTGSVEIKTLKIGDTVNYITSLNGVTLDKWKVFYVDENYTYIILDDYLRHNAISRMSGMQKIVYGTSSDENCNVCGDGSRSGFIGAMIYKSNWSSLLIGTLNGIAIDYSTSSDTNIKAMGSPTLDLYVNSWNAKYPNNMIYTSYLSNVNYGGYDGYYIGSSENPTGGTVNNPNTDSLYYPYSTKYDIGQYDYCNGYWLASPSAFDSEVLMIVKYDGMVSGYTYGWGNNPRFAFRPVICLPSSALQ